MVRRYNRLFVALHVAADSSAGVVAFLLAYWVRFHSGLIAVTKGYPPFQQYLWLAPLVGVLVPVAFHLHGIYRLRRGRSRIDDFFGVLVGSVLAVVLGVVSTLYVQTYYVPDQLKDRGVFEVSLGMLILGSIVGRGMRMMGVATLAYYFGDRIKPFIEKYFEWLTVGFCLIGIAGFVAAKYML